MEKWKTVAGFEDYEVSNLGRVRRLTSGQGTWAGRMLKPQTGQTGYLRVSLSRRKVKEVHRLVAKAFIPNPLGLPEVNHKGPKSDCRAIRLEWRSKRGHSIDQAIREQRNGDGVYRDKRDNVWRASVPSVSGQRIHIGTFKTKALALAARRKAVANLKEVL